MKIDGVWESKANRSIDSTPTPTGPRSKGWLLSRNKESSVRSVQVNTEEERTNQRTLNSAMNDDCAFLARPNE